MRRLLFALLASLALTWVCTPLVAAFPRGVGGTSVSNGLVATLTISGTPYVFDSGGTSATNVGSYVDPGPLLGSGGSSRFTEQRIAVTNSGLPHWRVYFDTDTAGTQGFQDVIVEYGSACITACSPAPTDYPSYDFVLTKGGTTLDSYTAAGSNAIPQQIWQTRWRIACVGSITPCGTSAGWNTADINHRPLTVTVSQLESALLLPTYNPTNLTAKAPSSPAVYSYTPMTPGGMGPNYSITGGNEWIGFLTLTTGFYVNNTSNAQALASVLAGCEGMGSTKLWIKDESTAAAAEIDPSVYTHASYASSPTPTPLIPATTSFIPLTSGTKLDYDEGHSPNICTIPFLMTGDPEMLEVMQNQTVADQLINGYSLRYIQNGGRYESWPLRNLKNAILATPPSGLPSWLLSQSSLISVMNSYYSAFQTNIAGVGATMWNDFGLYNGNTAVPAQWRFALWQNDMISGELSEMQLNAQSGLLSSGAATSFTQWASTAQTMVNNGVMPRINCTSGWYCSNPVAYDSYISGVVLPGANISIGDATVTVQATVAGATTPVNIPYTGTWTAVFPSSTPFDMYIGTSHWTVCSVSGNVWTISSTLGQCGPTPGPTPANAAYPGNASTIIYSAPMLTWNSYFLLQNTYWTWTGYNNSAINPTTITANNWQFMGFLNYAACVAQQAAITGASCGAFIYPQLQANQSFASIDWASMLGP